MRVRQVRGHFPLIQTAISSSSLVHLQRFSERNIADFLYLKTRTFYFRDIDDSENRPSHGNLLTEQHCRQKKPVQSHSDRLHHRCFGHYMDVFTVFDHPCKCLYNVLPCFIRKPRFPCTHWMRNLARICLGCKLSELRKGFIYDSEYLLIVYWWISSSICAAKLCKHSNRCLYLRFYGL